MLLLPSRNFIDTKQNENNIGYNNKILFDIFNSIKIKGNKINKKITKIPITITELFKSKIAISKIEYNATWEKAMKIKQMKTRKNSIVVISL